MKAALIGMVSNVGKSTSHHGGGYHHIMIRMAKDMWPDRQFTVNPDPSTWSEYDELYTLEGVNYAENVFNFMGGPQPEHKVKLEAIAKFQGQIFNIDVPLDFNTFNKRIKLDHHFVAANTVSLTKGYAEKQRKAVIGDSHSLSAWRPGFGLRRTDGKTLHGFLKLANPDKINAVYNETVTYFSNIDIRFHLMRQDNPEQATKDLFNKYIDFSCKLTNNTIVEPLPIEHESRKLPGTGLYKGEKYFGTREERMRIRQIAVDLIRQSGQSYLSWPNEWIDSDGTKMLEILEPKQSVHVKPKYYLYFNEIIGQ